MLQQIGAGAVTALLVLAMVAWSTRTVKPLWPALVFAIGRAAISFGTGATELTAIGTAIAAFIFGTLYFWLLQRTQGQRWWWLVLVVGVVLAVL